MGAHGKLPHTSGEKRKHAKCIPQIKKNNKGGKKAQLKR